MTKTKLCYVGETLIANTWDGMPMAAMREFGVSHDAGKATIHPIWVKTKLDLSTSSRFFYKKNNPSFTEIYIWYHIYTWY